MSDVSLKDWRDQNFVLKSGLKIGRFMVMIPTMVSRTPLLSVKSCPGEFEGNYVPAIDIESGGVSTERVRTTLMMAAVITKRPEHRRTPITSFLGQCLH